MFYLSKSCTPAKEIKRLILCLITRTQYAETSYQSWTKAQSGKYFSSKCINKSESVSQACGKTNLNLVVKGTSAPWMFSRYKQTDRRTNLSNDIKSKEYIPLYLCDQVRFLRVLCRLAKYSTLFCLVFLPASLAGAQLEILPTGDATNLAIIVACYSALFTGQSLIFSSRILCKIMMSKDLEYVKLSHISVFGNRRDIFIQPSDIVSVSEGDLFSKKLVSVRLKNRPESLLFLPQNGGRDTQYEILEKLLIGNSK